MKPTKQMIAAWRKVATAEHKFSPAAAERHAFALAFAAGELTERERIIGILSQQPALADWVDYDYVSAIRLAIADD